MSSEKRILFVCIENSCRSQMAEAFARRHGAGLVKAYSSGSRPSGTINQTAVTVMREAGYDLILNGHTSKGLREIADIEFDCVVTMGCGDECPVIKTKERIAWDVPDPKGYPLEYFRVVRDFIEARVKELLSGRGIC